MSRHTSFRATLQWIDRLVTGFERLVLASGVLLMAGLNIANVIGRNLFHYSLPFAEEVNQILIVMVTFIGIGYGVREARHIRMSALYDQLGDRLRKALMTAICLITGALLLFLACLAVRYVGHVHRVGGSTPALGIPLYLIYLWTPVGFVLGAIQYFLAAWRNLTSSEIWLSIHRRDTYDEPDSHSGSGY